FVQKVGESPRAREKKGSDPLEAPQFSDCSRGSDPFFHRLRLTCEAALVHQQPGKRHEETDQTERDPRIPKLRTLGQYSNRTEHQRQLDTELPQVEATRPVMRSLAGFLILAGLLLMPFGLLLDFA